VRRADVVLIAVKPIDVERVLARGVRADRTPATAVVLQVAARALPTTTLENVLEQGVPLLPLHAERPASMVGAGTLCFASGPFHGL